MTKQKVFVLATLGVVSGKSELEVEVYATRLKYAERLKEVELAIVNNEYKPTATNLVHSDDLTSGNLAPTAIKVVPSESAVGLGLIRSFMESRKFKLLCGTSTDFRLHLTGDNVRDFISQFCKQTYLRVETDSTKEGINANFDGDTTSEITTPAAEPSTITHSSVAEQEDYVRRINAKTLVTVVAVRGVLNGVVTDVLTVVSGKGNGVRNHESAIKAVDEGRITAFTPAIYNTQRLNPFDIELTTVLTRGVILEEITIGSVRKVIAEHYGSSLVLETGDSSGFFMVVTGDDIAITDKLTGITDFERALKPYPDARKPQLGDLAGLGHNMKVPAVYAKLQEEEDATVADSLYGVIIEGLLGSEHNVLHLMDTKENYDKMLKIVVTQGEKMRAPTDEYLKLIKDFSGVTKNELRDASTVVLKNYRGNVYAGTELPYETLSAYEGTGTPRTQVIGADTAADIIKALGLQPMWGSYKPASLRESMEADNTSDEESRSIGRGSREHTAELDRHYINEGTTRDERNNRFDPYVDEREVEHDERGCGRDQHYYDTDTRDRYLDDHHGRGGRTGHRYHGEHRDARGCSHCDTRDKYHCHNRNCPQLCDAESRNRFTHSRSLQREDFATRERRVQREMTTTKLENYPFLTMGNTGQVDVTPEFCVGVNTDADVIIDGFNISLPFSQVLAGKEVEGDAPRYWVQEGKLYMGKDGMFKMPKSARRAWGTNHGVVINCSSGDYTLVVYLHGELIGITGLGIAELTAALSEYVSNGYPIAFNHKDQLVVVVENNDMPPPSRTEERLNW